MTTRKVKGCFKGVTYWLAYFGIVATSFLFVKQTLVDFFEGETYFNMRTEPLTTLDTPTFTFCWYPEYGTLDMELGKHFNVHFSSDPGMMPALVEGTWAKTHGDELVLLTEMVNLWDFGAGPGLSGRCYKINLPGDRNKELVTWYVGEIKFDPQTPAPQEAKLYITIEENVHGVVLGRWYDGQVHPFAM